MPEEVPPLEPSRALAEGWLADFSRFVLDHLDALEQAPASGVSPEAARTIVREMEIPIGESPLPGGPRALMALLERAASASLCAPGPGYLAYIPGGGIVSAAIADLVADGLNRYTGMPSPSPALFRLEQEVLTWLCAAFGYGPDARAVLTPGGSLATLGAVVAARHSRCGDQGDYHRAVAYTTSQAHHSVAKAIRLAGIPPANLRSLPVDARTGFRLDPRALAAAVAEDRRRGLQPFLVVAAGGTTNTGAIDPLDQIAHLCSAENLWLHVDAAYGGAFVLTERGRTRLAGIERADSIAFDPHKGFFLPYGTGCLLARDGRSLRQAHHVEAEYLQDLNGHAGSAADLTWSPAELGPELSRDFRGLRLWLPLMLHGAAAFRAALDEKLTLADRFVARLDELAAELPLEIVARPQLSLTAFRLRRDPDEPVPAWNDRNRAWLAAINARNRVHLSSTLLPSDDGLVFTLRACILSFRTHERHIDACLTDIEQTARALCD